MRAHLSARVFVKHTDADKRPSETVEEKWHGEPREERKNTTSGTHRPSLDNECWDRGLWHTSWRSSPSGRSSRSRRSGANSRGCAAISAASRPSAASCTRAACTSTERRATSAWQPRERESNERNRILVKNLIHF